MESENWYQYLPAERPGEGISDEAGSEPAEEGEEGGEGAGLVIQGDVEEGIEEGGEEAPVEDQHRGKEPYGGQEGWGEVQDHLAREEDRPHEERVDRHVHGVAVVRAVEREVLLQIQQTHCCS